MPSYSSHQLSEFFSTPSSISIPYTNKMIIGSHDRGSYLVVDLKQDETGTTISAHPDVQVAMKNTGLRDQIQEQYGSYSDTRSDIQTGKADLNRQFKAGEKTRRLLTVGGFLTLEDAAGNRGVPLHVRNGDMPLSDALTHPSGLASELPHKALWQRINDEAGYCHVDKETKTISVIILQPDRETREHYRDLHQTITNDKMKNQRFIRLALKDKTGIAEITNTDIWDMKFVIVEPAFDFNHNQEQSGLIDHVRFGGLLAGEAAMPACVHDDPVRQTVSLTVPLKAKVPFNFSEMHFIDPEGFNRKAGLYSEADLVMLPTAKIPALEDFIAKLNGQAPAQPRLPRPAAAPAAAPAPAAQ